MLTVINNEELETIIQLSGQAIRDFLGSADASQFKGEAQIAITSFQADPSKFTDDQLISYGRGMLEAINYPVRIEVRGRTPQGAAQMVAKGIWGPQRDQAALELSKKCKPLGLHLKLAGTSSIEFNVEGVDKSLPIRFLQGAFEDVLKEMNYKAGVHIDSAVSKTVIAADGDGTIYEGPKVGYLPGLAESPVKEALVAYLKAGGLFMLVSGNDLDRSFKRLLDALPQEVYGRVLVAANGGAELVYANAQGQAVPISIYRSKALSFINKVDLPALDMVYIGDDGAQEGNDYPAFKAIGFKNSVLVAPVFLPDYDTGLESCYVGGGLQGVRQFIIHFLDGRRQSNPTSDTHRHCQGEGCCSHTEE